MKERSSVKVEASAELDTAPARRDALVFAGIAALAFALRFVHLTQARSVPIFDALLMDGLSYSAWADRIVAGDVLGSEIFYQAPLYPYVLALTKLAVGNDLWNIRLVQIASGSIACGILFLAGRAFFSRAAGIVAGLMLALCPGAIFFDGLIQKASLGLLWIVLLLWLLARARVRPSALRLALAGACLGLLMLTREETILLAPVIAAWILFGSARDAFAERACRIAGFAGGLALVLLPVGLRNQAVGGEFVLTTSQAGSNFYIGNNPNADGSYVPLVAGRQNTEYERKDAFELAERALGRKLSPSEVSRFWFGQAGAWIAAHPLAWLRLLGVKLALLVNWYEMPDYEDMYFYERSCGLLRALDLVWHFGVLVPLAAAGIALTFPRRRELAILQLVLGTLALGVVLFYVFARYRYPLVPVLIPFAAAACVQGFALVRTRAWGRLGPALLALGLCAVASNWRIWNKDDQLAASLNNAGSMVAKKGDDPQAVELFKESLRIHPDAPEVLGNLGLALGRLHRDDESIAAFRRVSELRPDDARAWLRLGRALSRAGRFDDATPCVVRALELDPQGSYENALIFAHDTDARDAVALDLLAAAQAALGQFDEAVATAVHALELPPQPGQELLIQRLRERRELYAQKQTLAVSKPR